MSVFREDEIEHFMRIALDKAKSNLERDEVAVGCVIVSKENKEVVISSSNSTNTNYSSIWHCELDAIYQLLDMEKNNIRGEKEIDKLRDFTKNYAIFVTCEPCIMCVTALQIIGLTDVYFGCRNEKFGGCGSVLSLNEKNGDLPRINCTGGILADESIKLLQTFYTHENPRAPKPSKKRKLKSQ